MQDNILFGAPFDEHRYQKGITILSLASLDTQLSLVIEQCALKRDLELFAAGDQTEVGERGITLRYCESLSFCRALMPRILQRWSEGTAPSNTFTPLHSLCIQARITLARAIYSKAEILLLDDVSFVARDVLGLEINIGLGVGCPRRSHVAVDR